MIITMIVAKKWSLQDSMSYFEQAKGCLARVVCPETATCEFALDTVVNATVSLAFGVPGLFQNSVAFFSDWHVPNAIPLAQVS